LIKKIFLFGYEHEKRNYPKYLHPCTKLISDSKNSKNSKNSKKYLSTLLCLEEIPVQRFEDKTNNENRLLNKGFIKNKAKENRFHDYYLEKKFEDKKVVFVLQGGLKRYVKENYNIEIFRYPDEAYIIEYNNGKKVVKILEKKEQKVNGTTETKLWACPSLKREYEITMGPGFEIQYGLCVNDFLKTKMFSNFDKYTILQRILCENDIDILYGDDENYFDNLDFWIEK
jgi:hypothetical protein